MITARFNWDKAKSRLNLRKHGISFEEARTVFYDPQARFIADTDHSEREERFVLMGFSSIARILVVCHCYRNEETEIRIISARKASKTEELQYERWNR